MKTYYECLPCFIRQNLSLLFHIEEADKERLMREVLHALADMDFRLSPPRIAQKLKEITRPYTGDGDVYAEIKRQSNAYVLGMQDELRSLIRKSADPFGTALKLAIAGNLIDFGAKHDFAVDSIQAEITKVLAADFCESDIVVLKKEIQNATRILYIGDNAGEIVFDRLFVEILPREKIIFSVRGGPTINDALMEDARDVGFDTLVKVISSGIDIPGTDIDQCSPEFQKIFHEADLVIAKGQGNYETLSAVKKKIFFLLRIKCPVVAADLNRKTGDFICGTADRLNPGSHLK
jgi:uncharacterized protein with ATP-grasp and redox domains